MMESLLASENSTWNEMENQENFPNFFPGNASLANATTGAWSGTEVVNQGQDDDDDVDNNTEMIVMYVILFVFGIFGNSTVFLGLLRKSSRKSPIILLVTHLAIADLIVTFIMIPIEIGWKVTKQWLAGNVGCKIFLFLRPFGLYLSSYVLMCISMDRYFAIVHPLSATDSRRRGKFMLCAAWFLSAVCSLPQSFVFHLDSPPLKPDFYQCVSFDFFSTKAAEVAYNLFSVFIMYFLPLINIIFVYSCILWKIFKKSKEPKDLDRQDGRLRLRRSDTRNIEKARKKTLRMTVIIVVVFIFCWTPYVVMTMWYMIDRDTAMKVNSLVQDSVFVMAVSNSVMNPIVYGSYTIDFRQECGHCFKCLFAPKAPVNRWSTTAGSRTTRSVMTGSPANRHQVIPLKLRGGQRSAGDESSSLSQDTASTGPEYRTVVVHHDPTTMALLHHNSNLRSTRRYHEKPPSSCRIKVFNEPPVTFSPPRYNETNVSLHISQSLDKIAGGKRNRLLANSDPFLALAQGKSLDDSY